MQTDNKVQIVYDREDLVRLLRSRTDDPIDIGRVTTFLTRGFQVQNDVGRPAYIFEVDPTMTPSDVQYLEGVLTELGVFAVLVPKDSIDYVGTITPESMGVDTMRPYIKER